VVVLHAADFDTRFYDPRAVLHVVAHHKPVAYRQPYTFDDRRSDYGAVEQTEVHVDNLTFADLWREPLAKLVDKTVKDKEAIRGCRSAADHRLGPVGTAFAVVFGKQDPLIAVVFFKIPLQSEGKPCPVT